MTKTEPESDVRKADDRLTIAMGAHVECVKRVRELRDELRYAEKNEVAAAQDVGRALRGLRVALNIPLADVARAVVGGSGCIIEYAETEDGTDARWVHHQTAAKWLRGRITKPEPAP